MNSDSLYRLLMDSTWFFLCGWSITLVAASAIAFRQDYPLGSQNRRAHARRL